MSERNAEEDTALRNVDASVGPHAVIDDDSDEERKHYTISSDLFDALKTMGFGENAIKKSIVAGCVDQSTCTQWIRMHRDHPELDTPLDDGVDVTIKAKRVLTEEERKAEIQRMHEKIQRKKEEKKMEEHRKDLERIHLGRKIIDTKQMIDSVRRELDQKEVQRQRLADIQARRRVRLQILIDKYTRQGKSTEEAQRAAEEELNATQRVAQSEAARRLRDSAETDADTADKHDGVHARTETASTAPEEADSVSQSKSNEPWVLSVCASPSESIEDRLRALFDQPAPSQEAVDALVAAVRDIHSDGTRVDGNSGPGAVCLQTIKVILTNIRNSPFDLKKRNLKVATRALSQKVLPVPAAVQLLRICNFDLCTDSTGEQLLVCSALVMRRLQRVLDCIEAIAV